MNKKAFSFIEVIITVSIITVLWVVAISASNNIKNNSDNSKVVADLSTIKNALESYKTNNPDIPNPIGNKNYYDSSGIYTSSGVNAFWVYGMFTQDILSKAYLDSTPLDPKVDSYYSFWKAIDTGEFELAWVIVVDWDYKAKVIWNYSAENWPFNLIRSFNSSYFVIEEWKHLPYNPEEKKLVVTDINGYIYSQWDTITTPVWETKELFFSDWSVSVIGESSSIVLTTLDFPKENNLITKIKVQLSAGDIWTRATKLDDESSFEIWTQDAEASVRWTIFWVNYIWNNTSVMVEEWIVDVKILERTTVETVESWEYLQYSKDGWETSTRDIEWSEYQQNKPVFTDPNVEINVNTENNVELRQELERLGIIEKSEEIAWNYNSTTTERDSISENSVLSNLDSTIIDGQQTCTDDNKSIFKKWGIITCEDKIDDYELYAYAPYNSNFTYYLSNDTYIDEKSIWYNTTINFDNDVLSIWEWWYVKYEGLNLWNDFIIEMEVKWSDLNRTDGNYYLLWYKWENKPYLNLSDGKLSTWYYDSEMRLRTVNYIELLDNNNNSILDNNIKYKIRVKYNWEKWNLNILESDLNEKVIRDWKNIYLDNIYIWNNDINWIESWLWNINYIKIFNK